MVEHAQYMALAERALKVYQTGVGRRRRDLHRDVQRVFDDEPECPQRRVEALCKLMDDQSQYETSARRNAPALRRQVFRIAARYHPLVIQPDSLFERSEQDVQAEIAKGLGRDWQDICEELYADVIECHRLQSFDGFDSVRALLSRYNVAQVQAALFSAVSMTVDAATDFKRILRAARLAKLMHTITCPSPGVYRIQLDGPASVLRETRRYGVWMAKFLPALIACSGWKMHAIVETRNCRKLSLDLSGSDGLKSHLPDDSEFDSSIEADFFQKWAGDVRDGWTLIREPSVLHAGQKTFVPDFALKHVSGKTILMEIVGFWTPEYIQSRLKTLAVFNGTPILLAIHESTARHFDTVNSSARIITYKTALLIKQVLSALNSF